MSTHGSGLARQIAEAAIAFERQRTGHAPESVSVMLGDGTLVIAVHGALSPAELTLVSSPEGAAKVEDLQRQMFQTAGGALRNEIERITGAAIRSAATGTDGGTGSVVQAFPDGTLVQVYLLRGVLPVQHWTGKDSDGSRPQDTIG